MFNNRKRCTLLFVAVLAILAVAGCNPPGSSGASATTIPDPPAYDSTYFQILFDNRTGHTVHLYTIGDYSANHAIATWLTGGGSSHTDWTQPEYQLAGTSTVDFNSSYDVTLDELPQVNGYPVLKVPFRKHGDASVFYNDSGRLYINLDSKGWAKLNPGLTISQQDATNTDCGASNRWDFLEFSGVTTQENGKYVCFANTTNVDFFSLGITMKGRGTTEAITTAGLDLGVSKPVDAVVTALKALESGETYTDYKNSWAVMTGSSGGFLRYLAPQQSFLTTHNGGTTATCLKTAIDNACTYYATTRTVTINSTSYNVTWDGTNFNFNDGSTTYTVSKPPTLDVITGTGILNCVGPAALDGIKTYISAYINRGVFTNPSAWNTPGSWYPSPALISGGTSSTVAQYNYNLYAKVLHDHFLNGRCYGFAYDDVPGGGSLSAATVGNCVSMTVVLTAD